MPCASLPGKRRRVVISLSPGCLSQSLLSHEPHQNHHPRDAKQNGASWLLAALPSSFQKSIFRKFLPTVPGLSIHATFECLSQNYVYIKTLLVKPSSTKSSCPLCGFLDQSSNMVGTSILLKSHSLYMNIQFSSARCYLSSQQGNKGYLAFRE